MDWDPVAVIEGGVVYYVRADHIGRPAFATDVTGAVVWSASYLPFGEVRVSTGALPPMRFPGQWFQSESGLHQNWMRDYDPTTGRYLQADPLGLVDGASVYGYALQNPGRWTDPRGEAVVQMCRYLQGALGALNSRFASHCAVFIVKTEDCGCGGGAANGEIVAQFSLEGGDTTFDLAGDTPAYLQDRLVFGRGAWTQSGAWRDRGAWGQRYYLIPPPINMSGCEFEQRIILEGLSYRQGDYSAIFGPNSNTAVINLIARSGGRPVYSGAAAEGFGDQGLGR